ncbi:unnamed protein product [Cladocopium goreaui]|uniref:Uncharacterized protein n=1 Tax=Cladocopium goreaui TaxID=2562237 RepID=A0A9P1CQ76_9DINO|nr:unnamed protein product [Cladocopium goreaui]
MESSLFEDLVCFLQKEELVLKALRATNLKACLRTGTGTKGYEANAERAKYYRIYNKIEKSVTADQKATLMDWDRRLCSEAEDIDFARLLAIFASREEELKQMRKPSLEACFNSNLSNEDKDLKFCRNFFKRKKTSWTDEQQKVVDEWEEKICGDGAGLCPAIDAAFTRLLTILENREDELRQMRKTSLEACFNSSLGNRDKDLRFCQNFLRRKKASMTDEQQKVVDEWEEKICGDGAGLCPAIDADFTRLLTILENREDELRQMRKTSLEACFNSSLGNRDKTMILVLDGTFSVGGNMLTDEQHKVLEDWSAKICCHEHVDDGFRRFLSTLHARAQELSALRKCDLKGIFSSHICKKHSELKFCQNFWRRNAEKFSPEQEEQVEDLKAGILWPHAQDDRAALRPAVVRMLEKFENILARKGADFRGFGAASVDGLFTGHAKKSDCEVRFCYDFVSRVFPKLEDSEQQRLRIKLDDLLLKSCSDRAASFLRAHPREVALQLTWGQRLVVPGAREAYAVATYEREAMGRSLGFTEATIATSIPPGTGRAKLCSASSMVETALESQTSTAASVQPPVVND